VCGAAKAPGVKFMRCGGCEAVRYCGEVCAKKHWRSGHRTECAAGQQQPPAL
jgi:hypothetical protein